MIEDVEISLRFLQQKLAPAAATAITATGSAYTLASAVSETLPAIKLVPQADSKVISWSDLVLQKSERWPIELLLPGGAYVR
jgi:hypothetical protein